MTQPAEAAQNQETKFMIQRIYMKNLSFETVNTPMCFQEKWQPELELDIDTTQTSLSQNVFEVVLNITATVKNNQATVFLVEIQQAGIFLIEGAAEIQLKHLLGSYCPNILFPYARETITSEVTRGGFAPLVLAPINFDAIYAKKQSASQTIVNNPVEPVVD